MSQEFKVVRGQPDPQELAAVIMVITAQAAQNAQAKKQRALRPEWNAAHRGVRKSFEHGAGTWRRSALPHPY
ncbi:MAG: acyl-CoA carboxylase subunit epsilon [Actinomycetes bacterium]